MRPSETTLRSEQRRGLSENVARSDERVALSTWQRLLLTVATICTRPTIMHGFCSHQFVLAYDMCYAMLSYTNIYTLNI